MRTLASRSFFHTFDLLLAAANPDLTRSSWSHDGVACVRERHSFAGGTHRFAIEVVTLTRPGRQGWTLMVVKEFWWAGNRDKELRNTRWAQLLSGRRDDALGWMRKQQERLDGGLASPGGNADEWPRDSGEGQILRYQGNSMTLSAKTARRRHWLWPV